MYTTGIFSKMIFLLIFVFTLLFIFTLVNNKITFKIANWYGLEKRELRASIPKLIAVLLTGYIALTANMIAENQFELHRIETAPLFFIRDESNEKTRYVLENNKGLAAYVSFDVIYLYRFTYRGNSVELSFQIVDIENDEVRVPFEDTWIYESEFVNMRGEDGRSKIGNIIESFFDNKGKVDEVNHIWGRRLFRVSFADFKNDRYTFHFQLTRGRVQLVYDDWESFNSRMHFDTNSYAGGSLIQESDIENIELRIWEKLEHVVLFYENQQYLSR